MSKHSDMATSWMIVILGFDCQQGQMGNMFSFSPKCQRPGLSPHSVPFSRYQRLFPWGYSQDVELYSPFSDASVRNVCGALLPPVGLHGLVFN